MQQHCESLSREFERPTQRVLDFGFVCAHTPLLFVQHNASTRINMKSSSIPRREYVCASLRLGVCPGIIGKIGVVLMVWCMVVVSLPVAGVHREYQTPAFSARQAASFVVVDVANGSLYWRHRCVIGLCCRRSIRLVRCRRVGPWHCCGAACLLTPPTSMLLRLWFELDFVLLRVWFELDFEKGAGGNRAGGEGLAG